MARIMLATSAGADARVVHAAGLRKAEETDSELAVVHVVTGAEYEAQPERLKDAIRSETEWLIRTMLHLAADRAGINPSNVTVLVRAGDLTNELLEHARSIRPDTVMLGTPREKDHSEFSESSFKALVRELESSSIRVERVDTA